MTAWVRIRFNETDYVAAFDLPCDLVRFRWRGRSLGPSSDVCVAHIPSPKLTAETICTEALQVRVSAETLVPWASFARLRFRAAGRPSNWTHLPMQPLEAGPRSKLITIGEADGLHPGKTYVFSAQLLSATRRSQWSSETTPVCFKLVPAVLPAGAELAVRAKRTTAVTFSWPEVGQKGMEFRVDVFRGLPDGLRHQTTLLVEEVNGKLASEAGMSLS